MFQTGVCRISVALYVFYGTYIYYIMFDQDGTPLFNFKSRLCVCIVRRHGYIKKTVQSSRLQLTKQKYVAILLQFEVITAYKYVDDKAWSSFQTPELREIIIFITLSVNIAYIIQKVKYHKPPVRTHSDANDLTAISINFRITYSISFKSELVFSSLLYVWRRKSPLGILEDAFVGRSPRADLRCCSLPGACITFRAVCFVGWFWHILWILVFLQNHTLSIEVRCGQYHPKYSWSRSWYTWFCRQVADKAVVCASAGLSWPQQSILRNHNSVYKTLNPSRKNPYYSSGIVAVSRAVSFVLLKFSWLFAHFPLRRDFLSVINSFLPFYEDWEKVHHLCREQPLYNALHGVMLTSPWVHETPFFFFTELYVFVY